MACGVRAVYKAQNVETCNASNAGSVFTVNGGPITNRTPIRIERVPTDPFGLIPPFTFTLTGWSPGTTAYRIARFEQIDLGPATADANGSIGGTIQLPASLAPGIHRVIFSGDAPGGVARTVQLYVDIPGRPTSGSDYSIYLSGFQPNETALVTYGGIDLGEYAINADGGLWLTLPVGVVSTVNDSFVVAATGVSSHVTISRRFPCTSQAAVHGNNATVSCLLTAARVALSGNNITAPTGTCPA